MRSSRNRFRRIRARSVLDKTSSRVSHCWPARLGIRSFVNGPIPVGLRMRGVRFPRTVLYTGLNRGIETTLQSIDSMPHGPPDFKAEGTPHHSFKASGCNFGSPFKALQVIVSCQNYSSTSAQKNLTFFVVPLRS